MGSSCYCKYFNRMETTSKNNQNSFKGKKKGDFAIDYTPNNELEVFLNNKYVLDKEHKYFEVMPCVIYMINQKNNLQKKKYHDVFEISYFPTIQFELAKCKMEDEKCMICLEEFQIKQIEKELANEYDDDILMLGCSHKYHKVCLLQLIGKNKWAKCAICSTIFGHMTGDQPDGTMKHYVDKNMKCSGYNSGTIVISYNMKSGTRNGKYHPRTSRTAYLPDTPEGREVFELLKEAFDRRLIFTVGKSVTTGLENQVVWNGIHHKTNTSGGSGSFGYPDPTYFTRVKEELAAKGVVPHKGK